jgi:hypothetical protein
VNRGRISVGQIIVEAGFDGYSGSLIQLDPQLVAVNAADRAQAAAFNTQIVIPAQEHDALAGGKRQGTLFGAEHLFGTGLDILQRLEPFPGHLVELHGCGVAMGQHDVIGIALAAFNAGQPFIDQAVPGGQLVVGPVDASVFGEKVQGLGRVLGIALQQLIGPFLPAGFIVLTFERDYGIDTSEGAPMLKFPNLPILSTETAIITYNFRLI